MPVFLAPLVPILVNALRWFFLAKLASSIVRVVATLGIGLASNEYIVQPFIDHAVSAWNAMPAELAIWISALGIDKVVSVMLTAYGIAGVKQLFLAKR